MAMTGRKTLFVAGAIMLLVIFSISLTSSFTWRGRSTLPVGSGAPAISLGERHGLILASDGSLWSWGSDFLGWPVLGLGNGQNQSLRLQRIGKETNWVLISAGASRSLALKSDGTLWTWGQSVQPRFARPMPINTPTLAAPGNDWKQAAAGGIHCLAVKRDGTLWAWGNNWAGSVGIESTNGSSLPVRIGSATNWVRVWASVLESVGMQADGSLWYWGDNPNPAFAQDAARITAPTRVNPDTNWVDVGFGVNTVFAIKSDGTLWAWGRQAHVYTGASDPAQNVIPTRVGTSSDWRNISASTGWWCQGLTRNDGSLWMMDASDGEPNGPRSPFKPPVFKRFEFPKTSAAYAAGAVHAAAPGVHGPIAVVLTPEGEVWTWGMILGDPPSMKRQLLELVAALARLLHLPTPQTDAPPVFRETPWQIRNT
jgi:alpha-tubulin suppressor-like RCC1 family protein